MYKDNTCNCCSGSGRKLYGNTTGWRGGIGGQAMTWDICDSCWGSGDSNRPWRNLRETMAGHVAAKQRVKKLESQLADLIKAARAVREACYFPGEASESEQMAALDRLDTSILLLPYLKTADERLTEEIRMGRSMGPSSLQEEL